jgi:propanol-preferring alcohol dehydrogenase
MHAYQLLDWQKAGFREVEVPEPGPGQVRVRVGGAGLCHSDLLFLDAPAGRWPFDLPMTLGHENAGWVDRIGPGVEGFAEGDAVLLETHWWCRRCEFCLRGADNYCTQGWGRAHGVGAPGGLAPYLVTEVQQLVPLGELEPIDVAPLADAGRTSYHAVKKSLPKLVPGSTALVIGVGGLGGYAIQWLRLLSPARIVAIDLDAKHLEAARELGAEEALLSDADAADAFRELSGGRGAEVVFDFVGVDATMELALRSARILGSVAFVGAGGGIARVGWESLPRDCEVWSPQGGTHPELHEVVKLCQRFPVRHRVERFAFDETPLAYERLRGGDLAGRAVVLPGQSRRESGRTR